MRDISRSNALGLYLREPQSRKEKDSRNEHRAKVTSVYDQGALAQEP